MVEQAWKKTCAVLVPEPQRVIASEYAAKFWLVADAIRYHRSDTALVKIVVPVRNDNMWMPLPQPAFDS